MSHKGELSRYLNYSSVLIEQVKRVSLAHVCTKSVNHALEQASATSGDGGWKNPKAPSTNMPGVGK